MHEVKSSTRSDIRPQHLPSDVGMHLLRAWLTVYVIAYLHLGGYVGSGSHHVTGWTPIVTSIAMAAFTLMSGYLAGRPEPLSAQAAWRFYGSKLLRIYPLYLLALAGFVLLWLSNPFTATKAALGLSIFWPEAPMTLWYVAMLLVFYALTPVLAWTRWPLALACALGLWGLYSGASLAGADLDERAITQFPAYVTGVMMRRFGWRQTGRAGLALLTLGLACGFAFAQAFPSKDQAWAALAQLPVALSGALWLLVVCDFAARRPVGMPLWLWLSQISFAAYLFHRVVFELLKRLHWPTDSPLAQTGWLLFAGLPLVALVSHGLDKAQRLVVRVRLPLARA